MSPAWSSATTTLARPEAWSRFAAATAGLATHPGRGSVGACFFGLLDVLYNPILIVGVACCLVYFFFSKEQKGLFGRVAKVGIWVLMVTFGAGFGYTVMGRIALLVGRAEFLLYDWLGMSRG